MAGHQYASSRNAHLVLPCLPLPAQDLVDVGARRRVLHEAGRAMRLLRLVVGLVVLHIRGTRRGFGA